MTRHHLRHEHRQAILANRFSRLDKPKKRAPFELEWNRDASSILVLVTLGAAIMTVAVLLWLFVDMDSGELQMFANRLQ